MISVYSPYSPQVHPGVYAPSIQVDDVVTEVAVVVVTGVAVVVVTGVAVVVVTGVVVVIGVAVVVRPVKRV